MKTYSKPEFFVTEFVANQAVSTCPTTEVYNPVTVNCVITGDHSIFYSGCSEKYGDLTVVENFYTSTTTNGVTTTTSNDYLVWGSGVTKGTYDASSSTYEGFWGNSTSTAYSGTGMSLIDKLLEIITGSKDDDEDAMGVHAGVITPEVEKTRNSSI